jgi:hypothetical protein
MGFFDRLFGTEQPEQSARTPAPTRKRSDDEIAVERYEYLLRTAPPETIEQVHTEAFAKLTPQQRDILFNKLTESATRSEAPKDAAPASLAVAATRQEMQQPGTMARALGGYGPSFGSTFASSLLGSVAGYVIGSAIVDSFFPNDFGNTDGNTDGNSDGNTDGSDGNSDNAANNSNDNSADASNTSYADGGYDGGYDSGSDGGGFDGGGDFGGF